MLTCFDEKRHSTAGNIGLNYRELRKTGNTKPIQCLCRLSAVYISSFALAASELDTVHEILWVRFICFAGSMPLRFVPNICHFLHLSLPLTPC